MRKTWSKHQRLVKDFSHGGTCEGMTFRGACVMFVECCDHHYAREGWYGDKQQVSDVDT